MASGGDPLRAPKTYLAVVAAGLAAGFVGGLAHAWLTRIQVASTTPTLEEATRRLEIELPLAASRLPYLVLDLTLSRLELRLSGFTAKSIPVIVEVLGGPQAGRAVGPGRLALLTITDRGHPPEVIRPPDPDAPYDPLKDPKIFPPDPPTDFILSFEQPVRIRIHSGETESLEKALRGARNTLREWFEREEGGEGTRIRLRVPAASAREIYRALYPGEKVLVVGVGPLEPVTKGRKPVNR